MDRKNILNEYLVDSLEGDEYREKLGDTTPIVYSGNQCFQITKEDVNNIAELGATHEEADTWIMLHARHSAAKYPKGYRNIRGR